MYAKAMAEYKGAWVSQISMGEGAKGSSNGAQQMMELLTIKTAKDLGLDIKVRK